MFKSNFKKLMLKSIFVFNTFFLTLIFIPNVFAVITDYRFVRNEDFKSNIIKYISQKSLQSVYNKNNSINFLNIKAETQQIAFILDPLNIEQVEIDIPFLENSPKKFIEIQLTLNFCKHDIDMQTLMHFFLEKNCTNLSYSIEQECTVYNILKDIKSIPLKYKNPEELIGLNYTNFNQTIYYSYDKLNCKKTPWKYSGLLQKIDSGEEHFYSISSNSLRQLH